MALDKSLFFTRYPGYLRDMFSLRSTSYSLHSFSNIWLKNYGTLFQIRLELLNFLISSATFYSMTLFKMLVISRFCSFKIKLVTRRYQLIFSYFKFEVK